MYAGDRVDFTVHGRGFFDPAVAVKPESQSCHLPDMRPEGPCFLSCSPRRSAIISNRQWLRFRLKPLADRTRRAAVRYCLRNQAEQHG